MGKLEDKTAIVTGASSGIGKGIAKDFAEEGANVVVSDVDVESGEKVVGEIEDSGGSAIFVKTDVSDEEDVDELVEKTLSEYSKIDILVNNAGVYIQKPITEMETDEWDKVIDVNLKGVFLMTRRVAQEMVENEEGKIINVSSIAGEVGYPNSSAYSATKGGTIAMTRALALELSPKGINVNAVAPGVIKTAMTDDLLSDEDVKGQMLANTPIGRLGEPEDIASAVTYLASEDADFVTGETLFVDGGWLAG